VPYHIIVYINTNFSVIFELRTDFSSDLQRNSNWIFFDIHFIIFLICNCNCWNFQRNKVSL